MEDNLSRHGDHGRFVAYFGIEFIHFEMSEHHSKTTPAAISPLSLRGVLLATSFFCGFCSFAYERFPILSVLCLAAAMAILSRRTKRSFAWVIGIAIISVLTSPTIRWHGGYPHAQLRLTFADSRDRPIPDVKLSLESIRPYFRHPLLMDVTSYPPNQPEFPLVADSDGSIICYSSGQSFGGTQWYLFWFIPMGRRSVEYAVHFDHPGYERRTMSIWDLLDSEIQFYEDFPKTQIDFGGGRIEELPIYEHRIILN